MSQHKIGPKEQQRINLRLKRHAERGPGSRRQTKARRLMTPKQILDLCKLETEIMTESAPCVGLSKPFNAPVQASAPKQETTMKKAKKATAIPAAKKRGKSEAAANLKAAKKTAPGKSANASTSKAKAADARARAGDRKPVPALDVANFMAREGGASMEELVKQFGIEAHPMRAKIHYVRHNVPGWGVEMKDGRYYATAPGA